MSPVDIEYFRRHAESVALGWPLVRNGQLRKAQLGAAWALASHATHSSAPAQIVLPTGVGKTLLLTLTPYLVPAKRVLVVAPGRLVRDQLADAFSTHEDAKRAGVLPHELPAPVVAKAERRVAAAEAWEQWREAHVVIGTVNALSHGYPGVQRVPTGLFDLVLFDEAHHLPAVAWTAVLEAAGAPAALFTATPFRRDRKRLPGELAFSYPLRQAIADRVFEPVRFVPVEVNPPHDKHRALAAAASARILSDKHQAAGSRLLVRTGRVEHARQLVDLYREFEVELGLVTGQSSVTAVRRTLARVRAGTLHGFACVGTLIEGFNFPSLKVAAYHEPHKTLAPTLQFVGRLARTGHTIEGELLAVREDVEGETHELYAEDRAWSDLLPDIVDAAVDRERETRSFVRDADVTGRLDLPPLAIAPSRSVRMYRVPDSAPTLDVHLERLGDAPVVYRFYDEATHLLALVTRHRHRPRWLKTELLDTWLYELHLVVWIAARRTLFVSSEVGPKTRDELHEAIGARSHRHRRWRLEPSALRRWSRGLLLRRKPRDPARSGRASELPDVGRPTRRRRSDGGGYAIGRPGPRHGPPRR